MVKYVSIGLGSAVLTAKIAQQIDVPVALIPIRGVPPFVSAVAWHAGPHSPIAQSGIDIASRMAAGARNGAAVLATVSVAGGST